MSSLMLSASLGEAINARAPTKQNGLQTPYDGYRDVALPSFKRKTDTLSNKRRQADLDEDPPVVPSKDAAALALDQRLHELINNLYFDVFPDEKARTRVKGSDQTDDPLHSSEGDESIKDMDMDDTKESRRSTEVLTSLISLERMGYKVYWEDTEELKRQVTEILRDIQPHPMKPLTGVGMEEVRTDVGNGRTYKSLPKRGTSHRSNPHNPRLQFSPAPYDSHKRMALSTYLGRSSSYAGSMRDDYQARSKRRHLSRESSDDSIPDVRSDLHRSMHHHYAFPDAWPVMIKNLDLDATEADVKARSACFLPYSES
jgi:hypothetical protein